MGPTIINYLILFFKKNCVFISPNRGNGDNCKWRGSRLILILILILIIYKHGTTNSKKISSNPMCHNSKPPPIF